MTDVTVDASTTTDDTTANSSNANDVNTSSSEEQEKSIPYSRFKEKVDQYNELKGNFETLETDLNEFKGRFTPKEEVKKDELPDVFDNPNEFMNTAVQKAVEFIDKRDVDKKTTQEKADKFIDDQFTEIEKGGKIDREAIAGFADMWGTTANGILNEDGSYNLVKANELYVKQTGGKKDNTERANLAPSGMNSYTNAGNGTFDRKFGSLDEITQAALS